MTQKLHIDPGQFAIDMAAGLVGFFLIVLAIVGGSSPAGAVEANVIAFAEARALPLLMIGGIFSLFLAFNLALYRHARRVYAPSNKRRQRGSEQSNASIRS